MGPNSRGGWYCYNLSPYRKPISYINPTPLPPENGSCSCFPFQNLLKTPGSSLSLLHRPKKRKLEGAKMVARSNATPDLEPLRELFRHHIESFDYMADRGLEILFESVKAVQVDDPFTNKKLRNILCYSPILFLLFVCMN